MSKLGHMQGLGKAVLACLLIFGFRCHMVFKKRIINIYSFHDFIMPLKSLKAKWPFYTSMDHLYNSIDRYTEIQPTEVVLFAHASNSWNKPFTCPLVPSIFQLGNAHAHKTQVNCCAKFCMHNLLHQRQHQTACI